MNNHNGVHDYVNKKQFLDNKDMEIKMREIAENENITFLKTLIKFKNKNEEIQPQIDPNINTANIIDENDNNKNPSFPNKEEKIDKQEDDSKSYIKEILDICGNTQTIPQQFPTISISPSLFQPTLPNNNDLVNNNDKILSSRKIMEDNSISSIQSLEQDHQNNIDNDDIKIYDNDIQFSNQKHQHKVIYECEPLSNFKEVTNKYDNNINNINNNGNNIKQKGNEICVKKDSNQNTNSKRGNKTKFFNNKKNIQEIEKLIKETKTIEKGLIFRPFSSEKNINLQANLNSGTGVSNILHTTGNDNSNKKPITSLDVFFNAKHNNPNLNYYSYLTSMALTSPNETNKGDINKESIMKVNSNGNHNKVGNQQQIQSTKIHYKKKDKTGMNSYTEEAKRINKSKQQSKKEFITASINLFESAKTPKSKEYLKNPNSGPSKHKKPQKQK